jgi:hypothetical protein
LLYHLGKEGPKARGLMGVDAMVQAAKIPEVPLPQSPFSLELTSMY